MTEERAKMSDEELVALIDRELQNTVGYHAGKLAEQRKDAMDAYLGEPYGNEIEGRSQVVSHDVADTIEWILPALLRIFTASDQVVRFEPQNPNDDEAAKQATDYVNYMFYRKNPGFVILYVLFKDALLQKNGFVKIYWEDYSTKKVETYSNLTPDELVKIVTDLEADGAQVNIEQEAYGKVKITWQSNAGKLCVENVPPEEIKVNKNANWDLQKARFVAHEREMTATELREMGIEPDDLQLEPWPGDDFSLERHARFQYDQEVSDDEDSSDPSQYRYLVCEAYPLVDFDGDGIAERRCVHKCGSQLLYKSKEYGGEACNYEIDRVPIVTTTPILMPHKLFGLSIADLVKDLQLLKTTILRNILDNMYLTNNSRMMALDGMVNIDDLLTVRPGGIVRVKTFDAVKPLVVPFFGTPAFSMLEYIDTVRENRTGVTRYNQGIDANSLNKTATGIASIMNAAQQRIELIARVFAETGVKEMMWAIFELITKHEKREKLVRLRDKWVPIDPRTWSNKFDMNVSVGLGTGSKEQLLQGAMMIGQFQQQIAQGGMLGRIVTEQNIYNLAREVAEAIMPRRGDLFFTDPAQLPPPQPAPDPEMEKIQMQRDKAVMADKTKRDTKAVDFLTKVAEMAQGGQQKSDEMAMQQREKLEQLRGQQSAADSDRGFQLGMKQMDQDFQTRQQQAQFDREGDIKAMDTVVAQMAQSLEQLNVGQQQLMQAMGQMTQVMRAPKKLITDANGEPVGVEPVLEEANGGM